MVTTRIARAAIVMLLLCGTAFAQSGRGSGPRPTHRPPPPPPSDPFQARPWTYAPRYDRPVRPPFGGYGGYPYWPSASPDASEDVVSNGYLALQVQPLSAHVYVDGLYVGNVDDVRSAIRGRPLDPGAHRLELQAPGYEPIVTDVRIDPGETTFYRGEMKQVAAATPAAPPAPVAAARPKTFYVIPGCYAGDKRPNPALLPRGCDASKMRVVPPVVLEARRPVS